MDYNKMNRMSNSGNEFQGEYKKVLCICSAGLLRSPTAALVLSQEPFNFNTRAAGLTPEFALVPVDEVLLHWADEIVCMEMKQQSILQDDERVKKNNTPVICLHVQDSYPYRDPELIKSIKKAYQDHLDKHGGSE